MIIFHYFASFSHLVSLVVRVHSNSCISKHGLDTGCSHNQLLLRSLHGVGKGDKDSELYLLVIAWHVKKSTTGQLNFVHLQKKTREQKIELMCSKYPKMPQKKLSSFSLKKVQN